MPVFHFNFRHNGVLHVDREGLEIESRAVAWRETKLAAMALVAERAARGEEIREGQFEITDEGGNFLFRVLLYEPKYPPKGLPEPDARPVGGRPRVGGRPGRRQ